MSKVLDEKRADERREGAGRTEGREEEKKTNGRPEKEERDGSASRAGQRGHSLSRTKVKLTEDPLDEIIEAMIQAPTEDTQPPADPASVNKPSLGLD